MKAALSFESIQAERNGGRSVNAGVTDSGSKAGPASQVAIQQEHAKGKGICYPRSRKQGSEHQLDRVMRTSRSADAMEESKASDPTDYGWSAHPESAHSKTEIDPFVGNLWYPCNHGFGRKRRKTSIFKTKPTRIYSAQRWAQGHCRQDAAALPDTMPTPVRHRLWHLLEARAVTSRARSHLLLASAGVAPLYECPSGFRSKIELDGTWKSADREKSLPWCQDAARVAQQSNTVPTFVQHRLQHLLGHVAEASTGGAVGVHEEADDVEVVRSGIPSRGMVEARPRRIARREYHGTLVSPFPAGIGLLDDSNSDTTRSTATALEGYGTSDEHSIVTDWGNLTGTGNAEGGAATNGDRPE
ncbi:hypothetical protein C8R46DRAFT_1035914 [Mycena filopes]|nr:hypothetical protein C8R46DRAFT_1035914 [Mycena filopes]